MCCSSQWNSQTCIGCTLNSSVSVCFATHVYWVWPNDLWVHKLPAVAIAFVVETFFKSREVRHGSDSTRYMYRQKYSMQAALHTSPPRQCPEKGTHNSNCPRTSGDHRQLSLQCSSKHTQAQDEGMKGQQHLLLVVSSRAFGAEHSCLHTTFLVICILLSTLVCRVC